VRELSQEIRETIERFQHRYPMTPAEVRQALWHVGAGWRGGLSRDFVARKLLFWLVVIGLPLIVAAIMRAMR